MSTIAQPEHRLISSDRVIGTDVYGLGDDTIGQIDHLLIEKVSGRIAYAIMSFGGFLGLAHNHYPIPWAALKYDTEFRRLSDRTSQKVSYARLPSLATTCWKIVIGRPRRTNTTASQRIGAHELS